MVKEYKIISDVPKKYRWDLEFLLENKNPDECLVNLIKKYHKLIEIKDSKYQSSDEFLYSLKLEDDIQILENKFLNYISNKISENVVSVQARSLYEKFSFEKYKIMQELGSENTRFFKNIDKIQEWIKQKNFINYKRDLSKLIEAKNHILSEEIENFRIIESRADVNPYETFSILTNSELNFGFAKNLKNQKIKITNANISWLLKSKDSSIRKSSFINFRKAFLNHKNSLSNLLYQHFKKISTWGKIHKFDSTIDYLLFNDRLDKSILDKLYVGVQKNKNIFKNYSKYHKKFYFAKFKKKMTKYDYNVELIDDKNLYSIEKCKELVLNSLQPLGKDYVDVVKKAFNENWIDFMSIKNKRSGAYSIGQTYGVRKKLISMNFDKTIRSVETLTHEIGHSMHSYFSDQNQHIRNSSYPIFLAEIASIFNEILLHDYLLKNSNDDRFKFKILKTMIDGFSGTVLRQVEWSNFEYDLYEKIEKGIPLSTYEQIANLYYKNSQKYQIKKKKFHIDDQFKAIYVPHFYYDFYVYKYAIGQVCANIFFKRFKEKGQNYLENYIKKFLSSGDKDWPINILKENNIDLSDEKIYDEAFKIIKKNIDEWIKLGKKIFKLKK